MAGRRARGEAGEVFLAADVGPAGRIVVVPLDQFQTGDFPTISDFAAGVGGDRVDYGAALAYVVGPGWDHSTNPFAQNLLRLRQDGSDTVLQINYDGVGSDWSTVIVFTGVSVQDFTAYNLFGFGPRGGDIVAVTATGGDGADALDGNYGDDALTGAAGDDTVRGFFGDDVLDGGAGDDVLEGGYDDDTVIGGDGDDILTDISGSGRYEGGAGNDRITVLRSYLGERAVADTLITAGDGDDMVVFSDILRAYVGGSVGYQVGTARISLGAGDDVLVFGAKTTAAVTVALGTGRDVIRPEGLIQDYQDNSLTVTDFRAGAGGDVLDLSLLCALNLSGAVVNPFADSYVQIKSIKGGTSVIFGVDPERMDLTVILKGVDAAALTAENLGGYALDGSAPVGVVTTGTAREDTLSGGLGADTLRGLAGADLMRGGNADDLVEGGDGNDRLTGGAGTDRVDGGDGSDVIVESELDGDVLRGGAGDDAITVTGISAVISERLGRIDAGDGNDLVTIGTEPYSYRVDLGAGDDRLILSLAGFRVHGARVVALGAGRDTVAVAADSYFSGSGVDSAFRITDFATGAGGDTFDFSACVDRTSGRPSGDNPFAVGKAVLEQHGADTWLLYDGDLVATFENTQVADFVDANLGYDLDAPAPPGESFTGTNGADRYTGTDLADTVAMLGGNDQADGGRGNDAIDGGSGDDNLSGGAGDDVLVGDAGRDILDGGAGRDRLSGGDGDDTIVFDGSADVIDGGAGRDTLDFFTYDVSRFAFNLDVRSAPRDGTFILSGVKGTGVEIFSVDTLLGNFDDRLLFGKLWSDKLRIDGFGGNDQLMAGNGDATILGGSGDDVLTSFDGADQLDGGDGDDRLDAGSGADQLSTGTGDDVVKGGGGDDQILVGVGRVRIDAGSGNDQVEIYDLDAADVVVGGAGTDTLVAAARGAVFADLTGAALIRVDGESVSVKGFEQYTFMLGNGADTIVYGDRFTTALRLDGIGGNDRLVGGSAADVLSGGDGDDVLDGGGGTDTMVGGRGNDTYFVDGNIVSFDTVREDANAGRDRILSLTDCVLVANVEDGTLLGMGDTALLGNSQNNVLTGNSGDNWISTNGGSDRADGGGGYDTISYAASVSETLVVDLTKGQARDGGQTDTLISIENVQGSGYADLLIGSTGANRLDGGGGDDILNGWYGNDVLDGGEGRDTVSFAGFAGGVRIDMAVARATYAGQADELIGIENALGSSFNDAIYGTDATAVLDGGAGNDLVRGGLGDDRLIGGAGVDTVSYYRATQGVTVGLYDVYGQYTGGAGYDYLSGFENLTGSNYGDTLTGTTGDNLIDGGAGNDTISDGSAGNDVLLGGEGIDVLDYGASTAGVTVDLSVTSAQNTGSGTDTLSGFEAVSGTRFDDRLTGDANANTLGGGLGNDVLTGGGGADRFVFATIGDVDTITDFQHGVDLIFFPGSIAGMPVGTLADGAFRIGTAALDADDRVIYDPNSGALFFDADGNGDYEAFQVGVLTSRPTLSAADFVVI